MEKTTFSESLPTALVLFALTVVGAFQAFTGYLSVLSVRAYGRVLVVVGVVSPQANRGGGGGGGEGAWAKGIAIVVLVFLIAYTAPPALQDFFTANTSGYSSAGANLFGVLPLIAEISLLVVIIRAAL